ncbi:MAG: acetoacetate decarboxylase family protein [Rhodococcus sp. (in: high G+C Gram-positive bacteria)]
MIPMSPAKTADSSLAAGRGCGFSQPYMAGELYPAPPYRYRGAESLCIVYETRAEPIRTMLPPGVTIESGLATVALVASSYQRTPFGSYREVYVKVGVDFHGERYMFSPMMYADSEGAIAAGRELWGFAKKHADMTFDLMPGQWAFVASRGGLPLMEASVACDRIGLPPESESVSHATLTMKLIPGTGGLGPPDVAQLVATRNKSVAHRDAFGDADCWHGRASLSIHSGSASDALHPFTPVSDCVGWYSHYDADLPAGEVIWDYLTE